MNANITNKTNQTMLIYVPAAYLTTDAEGNVTGIDHDAQVGNYTADTAPIVYLNECGGWKSSSPRSCNTSYIEQGFVCVTAGARSRDAVDENGTRTGKAPAQMVDLKSGVIQLRANSDIIPGNKDRIISIGTSGGGQMSSALGATGNMPEYYEYIYESGVLGVTKNEDGSYASVYPDSIYAAQCYCPIAEQANLLNATEILLGYDGHEAVDPAQYWRVRSGTADQHTSFSIGYNICLAAQAQGCDIDYHLVWNMGHGSNEGASTGSFIDWVNEICAD